MRHPLQVVGWRKSLWEQLIWESETGKGRRERGCAHTRSTARRERGTRRRATELGVAVGEAAGGAVALALPPQRAQLRLVRRAAAGRTHHLPHLSFTNPTLLPRRRRRRRGGGGDETWRRPVGRR
ncbi:Os06g0682850, partial [Oryza sativa Japonica Group]